MVVETGEWWLGQHGRAMYPDENLIAKEVEAFSGYRLAGRHAAPLDRVLFRDLLIESLRVNNINIIADLMNRLPELQSQEGFYEAHKFFMSLIQEDWIRDHDDTWFIRAEGFRYFAVPIIRRTGGPSFQDALALHYPEFKNAKWEDHCDKDVAELLGLAEMVPDKLPTYVKALKTRVPDWRLKRRSAPPFVLPAPSPRNEPEYLDMWTENTINGYAYLDLLNRDAKARSLLQNGALNAIRPAMWHRCLNSDNVNVRNFAMSLLAEKSHSFDPEIMGILMQRFYRGFEEEKVAAARALAADKLIGLPFLVDQVRRAGRADSPEDVDHRIYERIALEAIRVRGDRLEASKLFVRKYSQLQQKIGTHSSFGKMVPLLSFSRLRKVDEDGFIPAKNNLFVPIYLGNREQPKTLVVQVDRNVSVHAQPLPYELLPDLKNGLPQFVGRLPNENGLALFMVADVDEEGRVQNGRIYLDEHRVLKTNDSAYRVLALLPDLKYVGHFSE
jgi:hypothetical protein